VDHLAPSADCCHHLFTIFAVEIFWRVVAGNDKVSVHKRDGASLVFSSAGVVIHPDLKVVSKATVVVIV